MITLFIDSSRKDLSVALFNLDEVIYVSTVSSYFKHSNYLMSEIIASLNENNLNINDINNIIVLNGPGSFTGVRVGVTVSKTLAWALNKKIYFLTTLKALSLQLKTNNIIISIISDKANSGYIGIYENDKKICEEYLTINDIKYEFKNKKIDIICYEEDEFVKSVYALLSIKNNVLINCIDNYNYLDVVNYALNLESVNPHLVKPVYLKKIDAEKKML